MYICACLCTYMYPFIVYVIMHIWIHMFPYNVCTHCTVRIYSSMHKYIIYVHVACMYKWCVGMQGHNLLNLHVMIAMSSLRDFTYPGLCLVELVSSWNQKACRSRWVCLHVSIHDMYTLHSTYIQTTLCVSISYTYMHAACINGVEACMDITSWGILPT